MSKKTVAIVATGGTIAGTGQAGKTSSYQAGRIGMEEILESIPLIQEVATLEMHQLFNIDSNEMNEVHWLELAKCINELASREDIDGIVVTHGTDTLEETAYFLNLVIHTQKPVVITGAMRPATATSADGPFNLYQAVSLAVNEKAIGQGVMGLFSNTIYAGRDIQKINNYKIDAFDQRSLGCLGYMQDDKVYFYSRTFKTHTFHSVFSWQLPSTLPKVGIAYFYAGASEEILDDLAKKHEGIVIIGSGSGNYSKGWLAKMESLASQGIIFVRASRVNEGIVFEDRIFDPKGICIPANTLSGPKARVLLMLALTLTHDLKKIREIFELY